MLLATSLGAQRIFFESRDDVSGHAAEHLSNATAAFPAFALVAILLYATPAARRQPLVLVTSATWLVGTLAVLVGNVRVVDALVDSAMGDTPTSQLVESFRAHEQHIDVALGVGGLALETKTFAD
ncbi:MAG: hypothetical protein ABIQ15_03735 [Nocardioides sp.]